MLAASTVSDDKKVPEEDNSTSDGFLCKTTVPGRGKQIWSLASTLSLIKASVDSPDMHPMVDIRVQFSLGLMMCQPYWPEIGALEGIVSILKTLYPSNSNFCIVKSLQALNGLWE